MKTRIHRRHLRNLRVVDERLVRTRNLWYHIYNRFIYPKPRFTQEYWRWLDRLRRIHFYSQRLIKISTQGAHGITVPREGYTPRLPWEIKHEEQRFRERNKRWDDRFYQRKYCRGPKLQEAA